MSAAAGDAVTAPDDGEDVWRIRAGCGLLAHAPMSPERRALFDKEEEREPGPRNSKSSSARRPRLSAGGVRAARCRTAHDDDVFENQAVGSAVRTTSRLNVEAAAAEILGKPEPRLNRWEVKASVAATAAEREATPASQADARELQSQVTKLKGALSDLREAAAIQSPSCGTQIGDPPSVRLGESMPSSTATPSSRRSVTCRTAMTPPERSRTAAGVAAARDFVGSGRAALRRSHGPPLVRQQG